MRIIRAGEGRERRAAGHALLARSELGAVVGTIAVFGFFAIVAGDRGFLTVVGTVNYLEVAAQLGILVVPTTLLVIAGEFDVSIGSMVGAAGMALALPITELQWPLWLALVVSFVFALMFGLLNGCLVVRTGLPSLIVTLAGLFILRGVTIAVTHIVTDSSQVSGTADAFKGELLYRVLAGHVGSLPASVFWWLGLTALSTWILARTSLGNWTYGVGGDVHAARALGVPVARVKVCLFMATAAGAALVAAITVLSSDSADVLRGQLKEFQAIAATVIGGTLITGGAGSAIGSAFGALIFGMVSQGIYFTGVDADWFQAFLGAMLLGAVLINHYTRMQALKGA